MFFAADGMRQDLVEEYAAQGLMPTMADFLKKGAKASGDGLLTQAPPNTGAGWYTLATGAWPGVHGSTNNTYHINGTTFANSTSAFSAAPCRQRRSRRAPSAPASRSRRSSGPAASRPRPTGPTIDFRSFFSGRGVATNYISPADNEAFTAVVRPPVRPSGRLRRATRRSRPRPRHRRPAGPTCRRRFSPAQEMRLRVLDFGTDKYGLNAYIYDSTNDGTTNYDRVLFSPAKNGARRSAPSRNGEWADVKVKIVGRRPAPASPPGSWSRSSSSPPTCRRSACSTRRSRAPTRAGPAWPGEPGFTGDFAEFLAQRFPTSTAGDFAVLEAGIVQRGDVHRAGRVLVDRPPPDAPVRRQDLQSRPPAGRLSR